MDKNQYFKLAEMISLKHPEYSRQAILNIALNYYFGEPWQNKIESPAINNLDYDDLRKIIYILERMYKSNISFKTIEDYSEYIFKKHKKEKT